MAEELRTGFTELLRKAHVEGGAEFLKEGVLALSQALMEMEVEEHIGPARHERNSGCKGRRNGYHQRIWDTRVETMELPVPRVRDRDLLPLAPRAAQTSRAGALCGRAGSLRPWGLYPQGR